MGASDRSTRRDRQPDRSDAAVEVLDPGEEAEEEWRQGPRFLRSRRRVEPALNLFAFVQVDLAGATGIDDGRYPVRAPGSSYTGGAAATEMVLVASTLGAPAPSRRRRKRRAQDADPDADPEVPLTRLIIVGTDPIDDPDSWFAELRKDEEAQAEHVDRALACVDRALEARRIVTADAAALGAAGGAVTGVRVGYGRGDDLVEGRFAEAIDVPPEVRRRRRTEMLRPQERFAAILGGREQPLTCEELLLRARADVDAGRDREGALQLRVGLESLLAERDAFTSTGQADDLGELDGRRQATGDAANEALRGHLSADRALEVEETLSICERILRRRAAYGT